MRNVPEWFENFINSVSIPENPYIRWLGSGTNGNSRIGCALCNWKETETPSPEWVDVYNHLKTHIGLPEMISLQDLK